MRNRWVFCPDDLNAPIAVRLFGVAADVPGQRRHAVVTGDVVMSAMQFRLGGEFEGRERESVQTGRVGESTSPTVKLKTPSSAKTNQVNLKAGPELAYGSRVSVRS